MNSTMKRPWWGVFCFVNPTAVFALYLVPGIILLVIGTMIGVAINMPAVPRIIATTVGAVAIIIGLKLNELGYKAKFTIQIRQPFILVSAKNNRIILKQPLTDSYYWRWNPYFDPKSDNIIIKYGENWIETAGKTSMTLRNKNEELVTIALGTTIRANPSLNEAINLHSARENKDWTEALKEWLEKQIRQFNTTSKLEDYSEIKAKLKQLDDHYDVSIANFVWVHQFDKLNQELLDYLVDRLQDDWSKHLEYLTISSVNDVSLDYD